MIKQHHLAVALTATLICFLSTAGAAPIRPSLPAAAVVGFGDPHVDPGDPEPLGNTNCGSPEQEFTQDPAAEGKGSSTSSQSRATTKAKEAVVAKLGANSGVVCKNCEDGLQCERKVKIDPANLSNPDAEWDPFDQKWKATATYSGKYKVQCLDC